MCGIAGYVQKAAEPSVIDAMLARIVHRGPDGSGQWTRERDGWKIVLGHRRLSILDIEGGAQPMVASTGDCLTYNGELYNFQELRMRLEASGATFSTRSDTEVLLHHFGKHGASGLAELNGMFAFAYFDESEGSVTLVRDRVGIKPLYYAATASGGLVFASELSAILEHPAIDRKLSQSGLASYLFSDYAAAPQSLVDGVHKLPQGMSVTWRAGKVSSPVPYWSLHAPAESARDREGDAPRRLWSELRDAVTRQMVADVPVGVFLSGGLDSSSVAVLAQQSSRRKLKTFSIAFADETFDESAYAREVARHIGSEHIEDKLDESSLIEVVDRALDDLDEPLADASYLPTYMLSRLAAKHVKVALGGDGADEIFGGYPTYLAHAYGRSVYQAIPKWVRDGVIPRALAHVKVDDRYQSLEWKIKRFALRWDDDLVRGHFRWMSSVDLPELAKVMPAASRPVPQVLDAAYPAFDDSLSSVLAVDFLTYLPGSVLTKVDRASMAHSLEVRPPFLDNAIVDFAFALPPTAKIRRGTPKWVLKQAARGSVPEVVLNRKKKGFGIPLARWLRGPLRHEIGRLLEASSPLWAAGWLDRAVVERWADDHAALRFDHSKALWALLVLDRWMRREKIGV